MKKLLFIVLGCSLVAILAYFALRSKDNSKTSDRKLIEFAVSDTASVDKIVMTDRFKNTTFTLVRKDEGWVDVDGRCVQQAMVQTILKTFHKITFKGYLSENAIGPITQKMTASHISVEIFQNGEWTKTWFLGPSTPDHYGQYMLLDTKKDGKSDLPVIMEMKGHNGFLDPRFPVDQRQWSCSELISLKRDQLKKVVLTSAVAPDLNYTIEQNSGNLTITDGVTPIENIDTTNLIFFMNAFENIHFNQENFSLTKIQEDSIRKSTPLFELTVESNSGKIHLPLHQFSTEEVEELEMDYLWTFTEDGRMVRMQESVIGPLIFGKKVFVKENK